MSYGGLTHWQSVDVTSLATNPDGLPSPPPATAPGGSSKFGGGGDLQHVYVIDGSQGITEFAWSPQRWIWYPRLEYPDTLKCISRPSCYHTSFTQDESVFFAQRHVVFTGSDGAVHELAWKEDEGWRYYPIGKRAKAP